MADQEGNVPAGPIVDELGVRFTMEPTDRITEVLVLAKTTNMTDGAVALSIAASPGLDWIAQLGLITAGRLVIETEPQDEPG